jgi:hypothetical protein
MDAFNKTALLVCAIAVAVALVVDRALAPADHVSMLGGLAAGSAFAIGFELRFAPKWKPRVLWIFPLWIVGIAAIGAVLFERVDVWVGAGVIAFAALWFAHHVVRESRGAGGRWVIWMAASMAGILFETLIEREWLGLEAWWGYAIRGPLLAVFIYAAVRLWLARRRARV